MWGCVAARGSGTRARRSVRPPDVVGAFDDANADEDARVVECRVSDARAHDRGLVGERAEFALAGARAGAVIVMAAGTYSGNFAATSSGTPGSVITLCGPAGAVLDGGSTDSGYVFHLDHASYWHLVGFSVTDGQKGVMADGTVGSTIERLTVSHIGDEAIHLRDNSTDNVVSGNTVSDTGHRKPQFGEGIYIGTANSNWCSISDCRPTPPTGT